MIQSHRIFVGTVASLSTREELFLLKHFDAAIVDEASQILEPAILGLLSAKNPGGANAIAKFILIGDYKQLPAVVLQSPADTEVKDEELRKLGLVNMRNSLFERLYKIHKKNTIEWPMLHRQGRMHIEIERFPNFSFYNGELEPVPNKHQTGPLEYNLFDTDDAFENLVGSRRLAFLPSEKDKLQKNNKVNKTEAAYIAQLVKAVYEIYQKNGLTFSPSETVGVITNYRSQIALIKKNIRELEIPILEEISVDTVERYQGSQRDIILYSFSVNDPRQLERLSSNSFEEDGLMIDRKLNVALTRARKQLFVMGNPYILTNNFVYYNLIEFIRSQGGYIDAEPKQIRQGNFKLVEIDLEQTLEGEVHEPTDTFKRVFDRLVIDVLKSDSRTPDGPSWYRNVLGEPSDFNRNNLIVYGRGDFTGKRNVLGYTTADLVNLYCYYNMRKHYFSSMAIFKSYDVYFNKQIQDCGGRVVFVDFGCGPLTSGLAFNNSFSDFENFHFYYVGIDISSEMLTKAREFVDPELFGQDTTFKFSQRFDEIDAGYWETVFQLPSLVILNFSYLFANLDREQTQKLAENLLGFINKYQLNKFVLVYQNSSLNRHNENYKLFKTMMAGELQEVSPAKTERVSYRNRLGSSFDNTEDVFYEILSN